MKFLLALVLLLQSFTSFSSPAHVPIVPKGEEFEHTSTHHIVMENVLDHFSCSATAVGPHTLLTAGHCFVPSHEIEIDDDKVAVTAVDFDDNDHLLLTVDETFKSFLRIDSRDFAANEIVHMWGNPGRSRDVYRIGTFERTEDDTLNLFLMPGAPGDSGSGILDASGKVVGVLSVGNQSGESGAFVLSFTPAQLAAIK